MCIRKLLAVAVMFLMLPMVTYAMPRDVREDLVYQRVGYTPDDFLGWWYEKVAGRGRITVTTGEDGWYGVEVCWSRSSSEVDMWTMSGVPAEDGVLLYNDCSHYRLAFNGTVVEKEELVYKDGTGSLFFVGDHEIMWLDNQEHAADNCVFVYNIPANGGGL